jgi:hypothetical protein
MTTISNTFRSHTARTRRHTSRSPWRDIGIGLAVVMIVGSMTALGSHGRSYNDTSGTWAGVAEPALSRGWDESVPPVLSPLGALSGDVAR